ncbi:MAG: hypothetical protein KGL39_48090 [Patescibacteria group bacterium]|nr:hypothetical protein [Patescibacteria group bacterium]
MAERGPYRRNANAVAYGCRGKKAYLTPDNARADARIMRRHKTDARRAGAYRCQICHYWHVGNGDE